MNYRKIYQEYHKCSLLPYVDIHHIDGNRDNNDITNLIALNIEEHYIVHLEQGDLGAAQAVLLRITNPELTKHLAKLASLHQKELLDKGLHNFQLMSKERRTEISKKTISKRLAEGKGAFIIEDVVENSRRAGLAAAAKKAGFLNTESDNHGSKHVKGTCWWVNKENKRVRRISSPGEDWIKGMFWKEKDKQDAS